MTSSGTILLLLGTRVSPFDPTAGCSWVVEAAAGLDHCLQRVGDFDEAHVLLDAATAAEFGPAALRRLEHITPGSVLAILGSRSGGREQRFTQHQEDFVVDSLQEFRTPVTVITEFANMLSDTGWVGPLNERQFDYVDRIRTAAAGLIQRIEDFRKSLSLQRSHAPSRGDRPRVSEVLERIDSRMRRRGHSIRVEALRSEADRQLAVQARGVLFERALEALCEWSVSRAATRGDVRLWLAGPASLEDPVELCLAYPLPTPTPEDIRVLVEGTVRDGVQRKSVTKLFGVGVELARSTALAMGGRLLLDALPEGGGRFRLLLPVHRSGGLRNVA